VQPHCGKAPTFVHRTLRRYIEGVGKFLELTENDKKVLFTNKNTLQGEA